MANVTQAPRRPGGGVGGPGPPPPASPSADAAALASVGVHCPLEEPRTSAFRLGATGLGSLWGTVILQGLGSPAGPDCRALAVSRLGEGPWGHVTAFRLGTCSKEPMQSDTVYEGLGEHTSGSALGGGSGAPSPRRPVTVTKAGRGAPCACAVPDHSSLCLRLGTAPQ